MEARDRLTFNRLGGAQLAVVAVVSLTSAAMAQTRSQGAPELGHFLQVSIFDDLRKWDWPGTPHAVGGSVAFGGFLNPRTSFELEVDVPQFAEYRAVFVGPGGPAASGAPLIEDRRIQANRVVTVAGLFGFHRSVGGRLRFGLLAGLAIYHSEKRFHVEDRIVGAPESATVHDVRSSGNLAVAAAGIDMRVGIGRRFAVVPQIRAFQGIFRPAIGARVSF